MTLKLMEGAVNAVKAYLETNMTSKLDELDTEYGDITLDDVKAYYTNEVKAIPGYPAIFVLGGSSEVVSEQAQTWMNTQHHIGIVIAVSDGVLETLRTRIYRHVRAVIELLIAARSSNGWNRVIEFERFNFSPIYTEAGTFLADAQVDISVSLNEAV